MKEGGLKEEIKIDHIKPFINKLQWHIILYLELPCVSGSRKHDFLHENIRSMPQSTIAPYILRAYY